MVSQVLGNVTLCIIFGRIRIAPVFISFGNVSYFRTKALFLDRYAFFFLLIFIQRVNLTDIIVTKLFTSKFFQRRQVKIHGYI